MPATYTGTRDVPLDELTPFPGNAKRGDVDTIRASLRRNGQYRSLVVREIPNGPLVVLAGNHTMQALAAEGHTAARCEIIQCDDTEARRINLVDNRAAEMGGYDNDALAELLRDLDGDLDGTGYTDDDLAALLPTELPTQLTDPDDVPEPPTEPISAPGDVWQLGPHRLLCGDSTDVTAVEAMLAGDRCDCMWTDPPYGVNYVGKTKDALTIQNDGGDNLAELLAGAFATATAALKPGAPVYVAYPPGPDGITFWLAFRDAGWSHRQNLVWDKGTMVLGRSDYHYRHEPLLYGFTPGGDGRLGRGGDRWYGDNAQTSVFEVPKPGRSADHPTMKPVELIVRCLANSCPPTGLVFEPFGGSGSTLIAAHTTGELPETANSTPATATSSAAATRKTGVKPVLAATGEAEDFTPDPLTIRDWLTWPHRRRARQDRRTAQAGDRDAAGRRGLRNDRRAAQVRVPRRRLRRHRTGPGRATEEQARAADELRTTELMRLDRLQAAAWAQAAKGDLRAIETMLRVIDRRCRILGLDAPRRVEVLTIDAIDAEIERLTAALSRRAEVAEAADAAGVEG